MSATSRQRYVRRPDGPVAAVRLALETDGLVSARGYSIKNDYYNGINFAFMLNVRASVTQGDDATADRVVARRIRGEVIPLFWVTPRRPRPRRSGRQRRR